MKEKEKKEIFDLQNLKSNFQQIEALYANCETIMENAKSLRGKRVRVTHEYGVAEGEFMLLTSEKYRNTHFYYAHLFLLNDDGTTSIKTEKYLYPVQIEILD